LRKSIILVITVLLLAAAGYFTYRQLEEQKEISLWELVPANALFVYETDQFVRHWNHVAKTKPWISLENVPFFGKISTNIAILDSLAGYEGQLDNMLRANPFIVSAHQISKNELDFIYYLELKTLNQRDAGLRIIKKLKEQPKVKTSTRNYLGFEINEIKTADGLMFSYTITKNCFVGSFTAFLVEDVLRTYSLSESENFKETHHRLFTLAHLKEGQGDLYVNSQRLSSMVRLLTNEYQPELSKLLDHIAEGSFLDLKVSDNDVLLHGFSLSEENNKLLDVFDQQTGQPLWVKNYIPNRTAYLLHFGFNKADRLFEKLTAYNLQLDSTQHKAAEAERKKYRTNFRDFQQFVGTEIALATMAPISGDQSEKLLFIRSNDMTEALSRLNRLAEDAAEYLSDSLYWETYSDVKIGQIGIEEFPYLWLGQLFKGFESTFFTTIDQYIIFSNSLQNLKNLINDLEAENTWGKSLRQMNFLDANLKDANLSYYVNVPRSWELLTAGLNADWKNVLQQNQFTFKSFELIAFQFSQVDRKYYTNINIQYKHNPLQDRSNLFERHMELHFDVPIISKPYVVRNHNTNEFEVLVQDSTHALHLISSSGQILWTDTLHARISTDIHQIDYYKNGKLQYIFGVDNKVLLIDRNGVAVENWPLEMPKQVQFVALSVVDYDKSKDYRFMLSDANGNIYLTDKNKRLLEGWNPKPIGEKISSVPRHMRIRARDFMFAVQAEGKIHLMNRRGETQKGFPLKVGDRIETNLFVEVGSTVENSQMVTITEGGELLKVGFDGKIINKQQLYKPTARTNFQLIEDGSRRTFIIIRQEMNRVSVLNKEGIQRFDKDFLTDEQMKVQYYHFGTNNEIIAITDEKQEFTYLYNANGELIYYQPLESSFPIAMLHFETENKFFVYKCYKNKLSLVSFFQ
jgi:hypothetical protein